MMLRRMRSCSVVSTTAYCAVSSRVATRSWSSCHRAGSDAAPSARICALNPSVSSSAATCAPSRGSASSSSRSASRCVARKCSWTLPAGEAEGQGACGVPSAWNIVGGRALAEAAGAGAGAGAPGLARPRSIFGAAGQQLAKTQRIDHLIELTLLLPKAVRTVRRTCHHNRPHYGAAVPIDPRQHRRSSAKSASRRGVAQCGCLRPASWLVAPRPRRAPLDSPLLSPPL